MNFTKVTLFIFFICTSSLSFSEATQAKDDKGAVLVIGQSGAGKTILTRFLLKELKAVKYKSQYRTVQVSDGTVRRHYRIVVDQEDDGEILYVPADHSIKKGDKMDEQNAYSHTLEKTTQSKNYYLQDGTKIIDTRGLGISSGDYEEDQREAVMQLHKIFTTETIKGIIIVAHPNAYEKEGVFEYLTDFFEKTEDIKNYAEASIRIVLPYFFTEDEKENTLLERKRQGELASKMKAAYRRNLRSIPLFSAFHNAKKGDEANVKASKLDKEKVISFNPADKESLSQLKILINNFEHIIPKEAFKKNMEETGAYTYTTDKAVILEDKINLKHR